MKKKLLKKEETNKFATMYDRIVVAMHIKGYHSVAELNAAIAAERGGLCPDKSIYSKIQAPPRLNQAFYNMSIENLYVIADALDVSTDYLLGITAVRQRVNDIEINSLGLSDESLTILKKIKEQAECYNPSKIKSASRYYRNPYDKELDILNWIIDHIRIDEDEENNDNYDFLTSLYHLIMLNFENRSGAIIEAVMNQAQLDTYDVWEHYSNLILKNSYEAEKITKQEADKRAQNLIDARRMIVETDESNKYNRQIMENIKNGIINIGDPVTFDEVRTSLTNPKNDFKTHIMGIIEEWHNEFLPIYEKKREQQKEDYEKWLQAAKENPSHIHYYSRDNGNSWKKHEEVPNELLYRRPNLMDLSESEMKLYMLLEYLEKQNIYISKVNDHGRIDFYEEKSDLPGGINKFVEEAEKEGVGIFLGTDGNIYYSAGKAVSTRERNEKLFYRYVLPHHLRELLNKKKAGTHFTMIGYYDPTSLTEELKHEEIDKIYENAKSAGYQWKINGYYIDIFIENDKGKKLPLSSTK